MVNWTFSLANKAFSKETFRVITLGPASSRIENGVAVSPVIDLAGSPVISIELAFTVTELLSSFVRLALAGAPNQIMPVPAFLGRMEIVALPDTLRSGMVIRAIIAV